jgi:lipoprotein-releasing system permease protein
MLWGNIIGLGFLWLQKNYKFIKLDQSVYYVNTVPIHLDIMLWILLNGAVLLLSIVVLILPSYYISTLKPVKTLRFD